MSSRFRKEILSYFSIKQQAETLVCRNNSKTSYYARVRFKLKNISFPIWVSLHCKSVWISTTMNSHTDKHNIFFEKSKSSVKEIVLHKKLIIVLVGASRAPSVDRDCVRSFGFYYSNYAVVTSHSGLARHSSLCSEITCKFGAQAPFRAKFE